MFRDLKTFEEVAPIRHRRESRVLGVIFVCTLALRLKTALRVMLETEGKKEMSAEELLKKLGRVHRVDLQLTLRDLGPTSRIFSSSPCRIQFTVLYLHPLRGNTQNPAASLSTPKPLWRPTISRASALHPR